LKDEDVDENAEYIMDRYKKLEDSNFKRKFLDNITGSIEENLVASLQSNMVCLGYSHKKKKKKTIFLNFFKIIFRNFKMILQKMHF
jgi:hypothetical protein